MIPDYQELMPHVLRAGLGGEVRIRDVIAQLADELDLNDEERNELLPSGKQAKFDNRVHWARTYLKQAGLIRAPRRGVFATTEEGRGVLEAGEDVNSDFLKKYDAFREFQSRNKTKSEPRLAKSLSGSPAATVEIDEEDPATPDENLRAAYTAINQALASDILSRLREASPDFFEDVIVRLLLAMGYGGADEGAGRTLGRSGDGGVDGVIDQDPLGVDQIYVQAKLYAEGNNIGPGAIRDFFGALNLRRATKGIFVTASTFSSNARETADALGSRIVLIDGPELARLMIRYSVGCRVEDTIELKRIDEDFFPEG